MCQVSVRLIDLARGLQHLAVRLTLGNEVFGKRVSRQPAGNQAFLGQIILPLGDLYTLSKTLT